MKFIKIKIYVNFASFQSFFVTQVAIKCNFEKLVHRSKWSINTNLDSLVETYLYLGYSLCTGARFNKKIRLIEL